MGFYGAPRAVSYEDVAAELNAATTTADELLCRAAARVVDAVVR